MSAQFENVLDYFHAARCSAEWRNSKQWKTILLFKPVWNVFPQPDMTESNVNY